MDKIKKGVVINDELSEPLAGHVIDYLLSFPKETPFLDFKTTMDVGKDSDFPKIVKDVFAFSNNGGGYLIIGVKPNDHSNKDIRGSFIKNGLPEDYEADQATIQQKINAYTDNPIEIDYTQFERMVNGEQRKFAIMFIPASTSLLKPTRDGIYKINGVEKKAFLKDTPYVRRGTQSIPAEPPEVARIQKRIEDENYRLSLLSGEPDKIEERLFSNIFEVKSIPKRIHIGTAKFSNYFEDIQHLQEKYPGVRHFPLRYRHYEDKIVTFQDLSDSNDLHHELVLRDDISHESTGSWLDDGPKENIVTSLLNKEIGEQARRQGMRYFDKTKKIYYPTTADSRIESWPTRYKGVSNKTVAKKMWAEQLHRSVFVHLAAKVSIVKLGGKFFLKLNLTRVISDDGRNVSKGEREGTIITRSGYNTFNNQYLNDVLFWINKLGNAEDVKVMDDFVISIDPVQTTMNRGISWDIPTSEIKFFIENYVPEEDESEEDGEDNEL
ncbi:AlbA family DNA-binding domain-containing protein [Candidatus Nitrosotenuis sp. DW1]|uniref:AlbA family DNA-binding domain-containing protein n=1 Tax=Candidatus Nitrosotenuis sp. DW1 TaxID=2259672 RepID=UPI0015CAB530|nr:ATP-binding protein [Candidatus Nitrosotenuis sp. DW1]QLH08569.1 hypothetical protein DSQ19_02935 [Candidatus Nitrosotenuis sp. DW1]